MNRTPRSLPGAILLLTFVTLVALVGAGAANAASTPPGVHVDPGSPAAKEYSIPLSTARGQPSGSSNSGQLFGHGITRQKSSTTTQSSSNTPTSTTSTTSAHVKKAHKYAVVIAAPKQRPPADRPRAAAVPAKVLHPSSDSGWLWMVLVAVAVLAIAGIAGVALSRGHARTADPGLN